MFDVCLFIHVHTQIVMNRCMCAWHVLYSVTSWIHIDFSEGEWRHLHPPGFCTRDLQNTQDPNIIGNIQLTSKTWGTIWHVRDDLKLSHNHEQTLVIFTSDLFTLNLHVSHNCFFSHKESKQISSTLPSCFFLFFCVCAFFYFSVSYGSTTFASP